MPPRVYVETTIPSYLAARPSRDLLVARNQACTLKWWNGRHNFQLVVSPFVLDELRVGDPAAVYARLALVKDIAITGMEDRVLALADRLLARASLPAKARVDALHIAAATCSLVDYLLTWNCAHLANPALWPRIGSVVRSFGLVPPVICTPRDLLEDSA